MIILAAAVIISLSNNGIIGKANEAVEQTNLKQVQTIAQTLWAEEKLEGDSPETIKDSIITAIGGEDVASKYDIDVTETGVTVVIANNSGENNGNTDDESGEGGNNDNTNEGNTSELPVVWLAGTDVTGLVTSTDSEGNVIAYKISDYAKPIASLEGVSLEMVGAGRVIEQELTTNGEAASLNTIEENIYDIGGIMICCTKEGTYDTGIFPQAGVYITIDVMGSIGEHISFAIGESIPTTNQVIITDTSITWNGDPRGLECVSIDIGSGLSYYKVSDEVPSTNPSSYTKMVIVSNGEVVEADISDEVTKAEDGKSIGIGELLCFCVISADEGDSLTPGVWFLGGSVLALNFENIQE